MVLLGRISCTILYPRLSSQMEDSPGNEIPEFPSRSVGETGEAFSFKTPCKAEDQTHPFWICDVQKIIFNIFDKSRSLYNC